MDLGKAFAMTAVSGILAACASEPKVDPSSPTTTITQPVPSGERSCCKGRNACAGKSGCKTEQNLSCAGQNSCRGKGTSCPKG